MPERTLTASGERNTRRGREAAGDRPAGMNPSPQVPETATGTATLPQGPEAPAEPRSGPPVVGWLLVPAGLWAEFDAPQVRRLHSLGLQDIAGPPAPAG